MTSSDDRTRPADPPREERPRGDDRPRDDRPSDRARDERPSDRAREDRARDERHEPVSEVPASGGRTAGMWIGLILGAIILILLLIFVIQNNVTANFEYFGAQFDLPLGVAMLLAAIAGALVMALVGSVRMVQMSWTIRKLRKQQEKIQRTIR
ncbi:lipopolysaccharide assembly protein LapA domain-containing protein [Brachybacterium sp. Marseille-Q7125]|uniref:LapA family protein n=1 Tax=Brachybacterium sp. Marseille-Q7125 TaxID=2932815 RepID=UPI001FF31EC9|nr:lipopolysaccharide assembly protein LapA domain-containing protein [Brachybacterium sp. Marseille-Q7125]